MPKHVKIRPNPAVRREIHGLHQDSQGYYKLNYSAEENAQRYEFFRQPFFGEVDTWTLIARLNEVFDTFDQD